MKVMLTSSLGGSSKVNGIRVPSILIQRNGLLDNLKSIWIADANVLIICADPSKYNLQLFLPIGYQFYCLKN